MAPTGYAYYIAMSISCICCILSTIMVPHLCYSVSINKKKKSSFVYNTLNIVSVISSTLAIYNGTLRFIFIISHNKYINIFDNIFYFISIHLFYIIVLLKIQHIFINTIYSLNKKTFTAIVILIIIQICFSLWFIITIFCRDFIKKQVNMTISIDFHLIHILSIVCMVIFGFVLNSNLMILIISKLRKIISSHTNFNENINVQSMVDIMIKYTILFGIAIFLNQLFYILFIIHIFTSYHHDGYYLFIIRCLQNLSIIIALYLSFKFHHKIYYKICNKLHKLTTICCIKTTSKHQQNGDENGVKSVVISNNTITLKNECNEQNGTTPDLAQFKSIVRYALNVTTSDIARLDGDEDNTKMHEILNDLHESNTDDPSLNNICTEQYNHRYYNDSTSSDDKEFMD